MSEFDLVIKGRVVTCHKVIDEGYVAVVDGRIAEVGVGSAPDAREVCDATGQWIFPGVIDGQVHTGSQQGQEGFEWGSRSAAAGGVTTIVDMPYDDPIPTTSGELLKAKAKMAGEQSIVDFALYGTVSPAEGAKRIQEMVEAGACAFKLSTFGTHPTRFPRIPPYQIFEVMQAVAPTGLAVGVHNENHEVVDYTINKIKESGDHGPLSHGRSRPPISETLAMHEIYEIGAETGCRAHVVHCSLGRGFEICESYRRQGFQASIETCVHYLTLNEEEDVPRLKGQSKINPPIRPKKEVEAIWQHLANGRVDFVSTDHVSWSLDRKSHDDMFKNNSGVPGMEVILPLMLKGCLDRGISPVWISRVLSDGPARHFCLSPRKGALTPGVDADIAILEPNEYVYDPSKGVGVVKWSPYAGIRLPARVAATFVRGQKVWDGKNVIGKPGKGQFIKPRGL
jgi:allantoinase